MGLISADRSNKATLLLTIPRSVFKSFAKDLSPPISCIAIPRLLGTRFRDPGSLTVMMLDLKTRSICNHVKLERVEIIASSKDSDLEAFSRNPTHGSFAALAFQLTANTNYAKQRFLSY